jgi:hypothetical protein
MTKVDPDRIRILARADLQRTDWKLMRAMERQFAGTLWCDWRDAMRDIASKPEGHAEPLPPEPPFGTPEPRPAPVEAAPPPDRRVMWQFDPTMAEQIPTPDPDPEKEELRAELEAAKKRIEELSAKPVSEEHKFPAVDERLSDWGDVFGGADPDVTVEDLIELMKADPDAADAQIAGLSSRHRKLLTDSFKERMNELNNRRLRGVKLNEFDGPWLENHQTLYHKLAETGDRA